MGELTCAGVAVKMPDAIDSSSLTRTDAHRRLAGDPVAGDPGRAIE
jgi:hypothetical protein